MPATLGKSPPDRDILAILVPAQVWGYNAALNKLYFLFSFDKKRGQQTQRTFTRELLPVPRIPALIPDEHHRRALAIMATLEQLSPQRVDLLASAHVCDCAAAAREKFSFLSEFPRAMKTNTTSVYR